MKPTAHIPSIEGPSVESDAEFFSRSGPLPLHWKDIRQFPRFYCRSRTQAVIYPIPCQTTATPKYCQVLTGDVSRGGMSLLPAEQVFPGQRIDVQLADGSTRALKVIWCRRLGHQQYYAGAQFVNPKELAAEADKRQTLES